MAEAKIKDFGVIIAPFVTEKAASSGGEETRVVFKVQRSSSKDEIKAAVEKVFGVRVKRVNTINYLGKAKRTTGMIGKRAAFKKAYVTLHAGEKISLIEGV